MAKMMNSNSTAHRCERTATIEADQFPMCLAQLGDMDKSFVIFLREECSRGAGAEDITRSRPVKAGFVARMIYVDHDVAGPPSRWRRRVPPDFLIDQEKYARI
ncbi:hypothetical protein BMI87_17455 [Thioclava sp. F28-4]|nr:hypothetical protein BMI87_17455 [Thioclava sp. F28-4]